MTITQYQPPTAPPAPARPRPHYLSAAAAAAILAADTVVWIALAPIAIIGAYVLLAVAATAGGVLTAATALLPQRATGQRARR